MSANTYVDPYIKSPLVGMFFATDGKHSESGTVVAQVDAIRYLVSMSGKDEKFNDTMSRPAHYLRKADDMQRWAFFANAEDATSRRCMNYEYHDAAKRGA